MFDSNQAKKSSSESLQRSVGSKQQPPRLFETMAKTIGKAWKELSPEERDKYKDLAAAETQRYKKEIQEYREGIIQESIAAAKLKVAEQRQQEKRQKTSSSQTTTSAPSNEQHSVGTRCRQSPGEEQRLSPGNPTLDAREERRLQYPVLGRAHDECLPRPSQCLEQGGSTRARRRLTSDHVPALGVATPSGSSPQQIDLRHGEEQSDEISVRCAPSQLPDSHGGSRSSGDEQRLSSTAFALVGHDVTEAQRYMASQCLDQRGLSLAQRRCNHIVALGATGGGGVLPPRMALGHLPVVSGRGRANAYRMTTESVGGEAEARRGCDVLGTNQPFSFSATDPFTAAMLGTGIPGMDFGQSVEGFDSISMHAAQREQVVQDLLMHQLLLQTVREQYQLTLLRQGSNFQETGQFSGSLVLRDLSLQLPPMNQRQFLFPGQNRLHVQTTSRSVDNFLFPQDLR